MTTDYELWMEHFTKEMSGAVDQVAAEHPEAGGPEIVEALRRVYEQRVKAAVDHMIAEHRSGEAVEYTPKGRK